MLSRKLCLSPSGSLALLSIVLLTTIGVRETLGLDYRLDPAVQPDAYDIWIKPYLLAEDGDKQFTFEGEVNITLHAVTSTVQNITLHKDYIEILETRLYDAAGNPLTYLISQPLSYESATDKLTVSLSSALTANVSYVLHFRYEGQIRSGLAGFYWANYEDSNGDLKWVGITQAQRIDARTIVPCFDEPAMKAVFKMSISRPRNYNAVFNTRLLESTPDGTDRYLDRFDATPRMSSYLLAFVISEFVPRGNATLSIIARPEYYNKTVFSHAVAERALEAYNNYTQLPYSDLGNPVLQKVAVSRFPHNGMENWGLVIYKDSVLVQEPGYTDGWSSKQYTTSIIVHETSHMWFGNSVTFAWWSYFWLNEAFARYCEYFFTHMLYPEFQMDQQFVVNQVHLIFGTDALNSTQPLTTDESIIRSPSEIASKFSGITYAKGACIVRMFRNAMGHDEFDNAVRDYLRENHLKNTVPADLFVHLKNYWPRAQEVNLDELFHDWTEQVGFPMLSVNLSSDGRSVSIAQKRFLLAPGDGSDATLMYTIPITYAESHERNFVNLTPQFYMSRTQDTLAMSFDHALDWIVFNVQQTGFYRVLYDQATLQRIKAALMRAADFSGIHVINRAQLIDDLFNFAYVGIRDYDEVFEYLEYLTHETDYLPWYATFSGLTRVAQRTTLERQKDLGTFLLDVLTPVYQKLGFEAAANETVLDVYNRNRVIKWFCKYGSKECEATALSAFDAFMETGVKPAPDFRETLYCSAIRAGYDKQFFHLYEQLKVENMTSEREMMMRAMGCARLYRVVETYYAMILSDDLITADYKQSALTSLYSENPENVTPVFQMISQTLDRLEKALGSWSNVANVISGLANYFTTAEQKADLEVLIEEQGDLFGTNVAKLQTAVNTVEANLKWSEARLGKLYSYLDARHNGAPGANVFTRLLIVCLGLVYWLAM